MGQYIKTTGDLVTVRPKIESAANQGRMMLDNALIEMFNIMLPIGELKTFATDEVDSWVAKMSEYGQEWCEPDGRLLKCTDYPELFALIGYNYGWSSTNPNGTYTYTFTDVDGNEKSLVIYNDLDIDGNAKLVEGNPSYFRIPNFSGRFLRSAGTASYVNKWTDSEGTERQLLTEYKAEMYKGKLDAIRDISGSALILIHPNEISSGAITAKIEYKSGASGSAIYLEGLLKILSSYTTPTRNEIIPNTLSVLYLLRIF